MSEKIKEIINDALTGDLQKNALDFIAYLEANEMITGGEHGLVSYNGESVCYMHLDGGEEMPSPWTVWTEGDYSGEDIPMDDEMKETAWANVNICGNCGSDCSPGSRKTIFGKEFDNVCNAVMAFYKPDAKTLECVKKLLEMRKIQISGG